MDIRYTSVNGTSAVRVQLWKKLLIIVALIAIGVLLIDNPLSQDVVYGKCLKNITIK